MEAHHTCVLQQNSHRHYGMNQIRRIMLQKRRKHFLFLLYSFFVRPISFSLCKQKLIFIIYGWSVESLFSFWWYDFGTLKIESEWESSLLSMSYNDVNECGFNFCCFCSMDYIFFFRLMKYIRKHQQKTVMVYWERSKIPFNECQTCLRNVQSVFYIEMIKSHFMIHKFSIQFSSITNNVFCAMKKQNFKKTKLVRITACKLTSC